MSFLRGFLTGAAKTYNANTAAQRQEEAEKALLDREYGYKESIEKERRKAEALLKEEEFENDMFLQAIEADTKDQQIRLEGEQKRKTERLKAQLEGQGNVLATYKLVGGDGKPREISIPQPAGSREVEVARNGIMWFEANGPKVLQDLMENGNETQVNDFLRRAYEALDYRFAQSDIMFKDDATKRYHFVDKTASFPNTISMLSSNPTFLDMVRQNLVPDINRRVAQNSGFTYKQEEPGMLRRDSVVTEEGPQSSLSMPIAPAFAVDEVTGVVPEQEQVALQKIDKFFDQSSNGQKDGMQLFSTFIENAGPDLPTQKAAYRQFIEIDSALTPTIVGSSEPFIDPSAITTAQTKLEALRGRSPEGTYQYFLFLAANDEYPLSGTLDPTKQDSYFMSSTEMKNIYKMDPNDARNKARANQRVVRMTDGIVEGLEAGGNVGFAGNLQRLARGAGGNFGDILNVADEIIGALTNNPTANQADQALREQQTRFLQDVTSRIRRGDTITDTNMIQYYSTLLAYASAVAVQGGDAAARTVSDQDVQRVANGIAPAAGDRQLISRADVYEVTLAARHEAREQLQIYNGYSSQNMVQARASYYYSKVYGTRPANIRDLMKIRLSETSANAIFGGGQVESSASTGASSAKGKLGSAADEAINQFLRRNQPTPGPLPSQQ